MLDFFDTIAFAYKLFFVAIICAIPAYLLLKLMGGLARSTKKTIRSIR